MNTTIWLRAWRERLRGGGVPGSGAELQTQISARTALKSRSFPASRPWAARPWAVFRMVPLNSLNHLGPEP